MNIFTLLLNPPKVNGLDLCYNSFSGGVLANNSSEQNKYIGKSKGKVKILTKAEYDKNLVANFNKPSELNKTIQGSEAINSNQPEPTKTPTENTAKPPTENFNPQMDEPPKDNQDNQDNQENQAGQPTPNDPQNPNHSDDSTQDQTTPDQGAPENVRKKPLDRAKEFYEQKKKAFVEGVKKRFSKAGLQAAGKAIWTFVAAFWPYILAVLVIIFILLMIAGSCSKTTGKTPIIVLDKVRDKTLVLKTLAVSGDQSSQQQLIVNEATDIKAKIKRLHYN